MKRLLIILLALATALLFAVPASAKKGGIPGPPDPEPEPPNVTTCVSPWWDGDIMDSDEDGFSDDFTLILDAVNEGACVDVLTEFAGQWFVTVELLEGKGPRSVLIVPRDGTPGDSCGGYRLRGDAVYDLWTLPHPEDPREQLLRDSNGVPLIPVATVNACPGNDEAGVGFFGELIERDTDDDGDVDETVAVMERTDEPHPLALLVFTGLKGDDRIAVHVDLPGTD